MWWSSLLSCDFDGVWAKAGASGSTQPGCFAEVCIIFSRWLWIVNTQQLAGPRGWNWDRNQRLCSFTWQIWLVTCYLKCSFFIEFYSCCHLPRHSIYIGAWVAFSPVISKAWLVHLWFQAPSRQVMHYWLQQLQQKRWEYSNTRGSGQRNSWSSPILAHPPTGLVGKDNGMQVHTHTHSCYVSCGHSFSLVQAFTSWKFTPVSDGFIFTLVELFLLPGSRVPAERALGQRCAKHAHIHTVSFSRQSNTVHVLGVDPWPPDEVRHVSHMSRLYLKLRDRLESDKCRYHTKAMLLSWGWKRRHCMRILSLYRGVFFKSAYD